MTNKPLDGLADKTAIITGGSQGLGAATAHLFAQRGARNLVLVGRNKARGNAVAASIRTTHPSCKATFIRADLAQYESIETIFDHAHLQFDRLDCLVNVAGLSARGNILDTTVEQYDKMLNTNLRAPFFLMQAAAKWMRNTHNAGSIVNIGSIAAYAGMPFISAYCASKGGLNVLTRNTAHALMRDHIRVNCLNIGWMASDEEDIIQQKYHDAQDGWQEEAGALLPFGRLIDPDEVARAIAFLACDESGLMTGSVVNFDQSVWGASDAMVVPESRLD